MDALRTGTLLQGGTYRIEHVLGQGGFGITYLATDINLKRKVAIKEFFPKDYCNREGDSSHVTLGTSNTAERVKRLRARFLREGQNIAALDNPGVIRIFAAFEENNTAYYVMEYIEGESLSAMVKHQGPLPEHQTLKYIRQVADALEYVHGRCINHLDIKPANILVRKSDDRTILIDFGLSRLFEDENGTNSSSIIGMTHGFAPMEQYTPGGLRNFSPKTDLYSLAATLYYLLSGVVPPEAPRLVDQALTFPDEIPLSLVGPISKAMSTSRAGRHESVHAFIEDLDHASVEEKYVATIVNDPVVTIKDKSDLDQENEPESVSAHKSEKISSMRILIVSLICVAIIATAITVKHFVNSGSEETVNTDTIPMDTVPPLPEDEIVDVTDYVLVTPMGKAVFTGSLKRISATGEEYAVGKGKAKIFEGKYEGNTYDGMFEDGKMQGKATYTYGNGDVFDGTFVDNKFEKGRYTQKETGDYYDGTYKSGQPYNGYWYDKDGNETFQVKNGSNSNPGISNGSGDQNLTHSQIYEKAEAAYKKKDYQQAFNLYAKAANQGYALAQLSLGYMYYNGYGVVKNNSEAMKWYQKAYDNGIKSAERMIKLLKVEIEKQ